MYDLLLQPRIKGLIPPKMLKQPPKMFCNIGKTQECKNILWNGPWKIPFHFEVKLQRISKTFNHFQHIYFWKSLLYGCFRKTAMKWNIKSLATHKSELATCQICYIWSRFCFTIQTLLTMAHYSWVTRESENFQW